MPSIRSKGVMLSTAIALAAAAAVVALVTHLHEDGSAAWQALTAIGPGTITLAAGLSLVNYYLRFVRWQAFIQTISQVKIPHRRHLLIYVAGFSLTTTPGKVGELVRHAWLSQHGVAAPATAAAFTLERLLDVLVMVLLASAAITVLGEQKWLGWLLTLAVCAGVLGLSSWRLLHWFGQRLQAVHGATSRFLCELADQARRIRSRALLSGLTLGAVAWACEGLALWLIVAALSPDASPSVVVITGIYAASLLAGAASFLPGGLGVAEVTLTAGLSLTGMPLPVAAIAALLSRLITLWFGVGVGIAAAAMLGAPGRVENAS